jgi:hypothetical protein
VSKENLLNFLLNGLQAITVAFDGLYPVCLVSCALWAGLILKQWKILLANTIFQVNIFPLKSPVNDCLDG